MRTDPLVRIFDLVTTEQNVPEDLSTRKLLFPPVYVGLGAALKERHWQIVGKGPIGDFTFPKFRFSFGLKPGTYHDWKIYDGKTLTKIGDLPVELRSLEILAGWPAQAVEDRILTGKFPGVFDDVY